VQKQFLFTFIINSGQFCEKVVPRFIEQDGVVINEHFLKILKTPNALHVRCQLLHFLFRTTFLDHLGKP